jgi:hypothetical protein
MFKRYLFITASLLLLIACNNNKLDIDISGIKVNPLKVERLENDIFSINSKNFDEKNKKNSLKYGNFYEHYILLSFINKNGINDSLFKFNLLIQFASCSYKLLFHISSTLIRVAKS